MIALPERDFAHALTINMRLDLLLVVLVQRFDVRVGIGSAPFDGLLSQWVYMLLVHHSTLLLGLSIVWLGRLPC